MGSSEPARSVSSSRFRLIIGVVLAVTASAAVQAQDASCTAGVVVESSRLVTPEPVSRDPLQRQLDLSIHVANDPSCAVVTLDFVGWGDISSVDGMEPRECYLGDGFCRFRVRDGLRSLTASFVVYDELAKVSAGFYTCRICGAAEDMGSGAGDVPIESPIPERQVSSPLSSGAEQGGFLDTSERQLGGSECEDLRGPLRRQLQALTKAIEASSDADPRAVCLAELYREASGSWSCGMLRTLVDQPDYKATLLETAESCAASRQPEPVDGEIAGFFDELTSPAAISVDAFREQSAPSATFQSPFASEDTVERLTSFERDQLRALQDAQRDLGALSNSAGSEPAAADNGGSPSGGSAYSDFDKVEIPRSGPDSCGNRRGPQLGGTPACK